MRSANIRFKRTKKYAGMITGKTLKHMRSVPCVPCAIYRYAVLCDWPGAFIYNMRPVDLEQVNTPLNAWLAPDSKLLNAVFGTKDV